MYEFLLLQWDYLGVTHQPNLDSKWFRPGFIYLEIETIKLISEAVNWRWVLDRKIQTIY